MADKEKMEHLSNKQLEEFIKGRTATLKHTNLDVLRDQGKRLTEPLKAAIEELEGREWTKELNWIWGYNRTVALQQANICLLNCGPTGSEIAKCLSRTGIRKITIVDGTKVKASDLKNNFMVNEASIGQPKANCVCSFVQKINPDVEATPIEEYPQLLIDTNAFFFSKFTIVIATQLVTNLMEKLDSICQATSTTLIFARSYGLAGFVRVCAKNHYVMDSKAVLNDLRLRNPWPELKQYALSVEPDAVHENNIPFIVILIKWVEEQGGNLQLTTIDDFLKEHLKCLRRLDGENYEQAIEAVPEFFSTKGKDLKVIVADSYVDHNSSDFMVMVAALKEFIEKEGHGEPPLEGSIPPMGLSSGHLKRLKQIYKEKAETDFLSFKALVRSTLRTIKRDEDSISDSTIRIFCKNAKKLKMSEFCSIEKELSLAFQQQELRKYLSDEDYSHAAMIYILLQVIDRFAAEYNEFPRRSGREMNAEFVVEQLFKLKIGWVELADDLIIEMCRWGAIELQGVASVIGGIASNEAIKLITHEGLPMSGTLIAFDHKSQLLRFF